MKERNRCLDFIKGMACIGVVFMHCTFPYPFGQVISFVFKFSVPVFFMISGYYCYSDNSEYVRQKLKRKMKHILSILLYSEGLYLVALIVVLVLENKPISLGALITKQGLLSAIFINKPMFNGTLWFLYALLFSYLILYVVNSLDCYSLAYKSIVLVLLGHIIVRTVLKNMNVEWYDATYFRNALFYGFPLLLLGNLIKKYEMKCCKISIKVCVAGIMSGIIITFIEYFLTRQVLDFYIGTLVTSYCLYIFALKNKRNPMITLVEKIGCKLSLGIYIIHIMCINITESSLSYFKLQNSTIVQWTKPIICVVMAILIVSLFELCKNKVCKSISLKVSMNAK